MSNLLLVSAIFLLGGGAEWCCSAANILFIPPWVSPSHKLSMLPWADLLAERGHNVLVWSLVFVEDKYRPKLAKHQQIVANSLPLNSWINRQIMALNSSDTEKRIWSRTFNIPAQETLVELISTVFCTQVLETRMKEVMDPILEQKWDVIIIDELFNPCGQFVAHELKKRYNTSVSSFVSTSRAPLHTSESSGVPQPPSYVSSMGILQTYTGTMNFFQRAHSVSLLFLAKSVTMLSEYLSLKLIAKHSDMQHIHSPVQQSAIFYHNYMQVSDMPSPILPQFVFMGGIQMTNMQPNADLKPEIRAMVEKHRTPYDPRIFLYIPINSHGCWSMLQLIKFMQPSSKGTVLVTFGHVLPLDKAPHWISSGLLAGLQRLAADGYTVLVQYTGSNVIEQTQPPTQAYPALHFMSWIPVQQLLVHDRTVAVVSHGGGNSITELMHAGIPALLLPIAADQPDGAARAVRMGFAKSLRKMDITEHSVYTALTKLINDKSWKSRAMKVANMMKDKVVNPKDLSVFWTEHSVKHRDYVTFRRFPGWITEQGFCNSIKYYSLDIFAAFSSLMILSAFMIFKFFLSMYLWVRSFNS